MSHIGIIYIGKIHCRCPNVQTGNGHSIINAEAIVYTPPQMVVNGVQEFVGSKRGQAIKFVKNATSLLPVNITKHAQSIAISISNFDIPNELIVEWIAFDDRHDQDIRAGENRGRFVEYSTPIRSIQYGKIDPQNRTAEVDLSSIKSFDNLAVLIRSKVAGPIIAAGKLKL